MGTALPLQEHVGPSLGRDARLQGLAGRLRALGSSEGELSPLEARQQRVELREAARDFEAMFLNLLIQEMRPDEGEDEMLGGGLGNRYYTEMFDAELSKLLSRTGQLGLAEMIERQVAGQIGLDEAEDGTIPGEGVSRALIQPLRRVAASAYRASEMFLRPLVGRLSSVFGMRDDPIDGVRRHHNGIDIAAELGSPVAAAADGRVSFSGRSPGYGNLVVVEHAGGYQTRYAHNANNIVRKGEVVRAGQAVASVGDSGRATGPHLHFEVRRSGEPLDPLALLR